MRKHILLAAVFPLLLSSQSWADFSEGTQAYDRGNYVTAMNELHPLAEQGLAPAQFYLGLMYENGQSVPQDYEEAARWYLKAAKQGHDGAQNNLGKLYEEGQGVEQDHIIAVQWYHKAADQGLSAAQFNLAEMYMNGRGVKPNTDQAQVWYRKAAAQGHRKAIAELRQFPEPPTPVETPKTVEPPEKVESPEKSNRPRRSSRRTKRNPRRKCRRKSHRRQTTLATLSAPSASARKKSNAPFRLTVSTPTWKAPKSVSLALQRPTLNFRSACQGMGTH